MPDTEPRRAYVHMSRRPKARIWMLRTSWLQRVENIVSKYEDIRYVISNIGAEGGDPFSQGGTGTHINRVALDFKDFHDRKTLSSTVVNEVREKIAWTLSKGLKCRWKRKRKAPPPVRR